MTEMIPMMLREGDSRDQRLNEPRPSSTLNSRRYSVSPENSMQYSENEEQIAEGNFVAYHGNPQPQSHRLLPGENATTTNDFQRLTTQERYSETGSIKPKQSSRPKVNHTWRLEIGAVVLSLCAMVALIVLLGHADNQPLNKWRFFISFNAIISILGAVARAPLGLVTGSCLGQAKWNWFKKRPDSLSAFEKFEEASRGPMGSFWLLSWLRFRHWSVLGALVTLILLGFEPFLQAIVDYEGQSDHSTNLNPPIIGASEYLDVGSYSRYSGTGGVANIILPNGVIVPTVAFESIPDGGVTAALINGLGNATKDTEFAPSFSCLSGNCTWVPYTTLATCSVCNDVSASLTKNTSYGDGSLATHYLSNARILQNYTTHALPYVSLTNGDEETITPTYMIATAISNPGLTVSFQNLNTLIAAVGIIRSSLAYNGSNWPEEPPHAMECALYFCTKTYSTKVDRGVLYESVMESRSDRDPQSYAYIPGEPVTLNSSTLAALEAWNNQSLRDSHVQFQRTDLRLLIPKEEASKSGLPDNATLVFNISQASAETSSFAVTHQLFWDGQVTWPLMNGNGGALQPVVAQALGTRQIEDYSDLFGNMAKSMTAFMRDRSNTTRTGAQTEWVIHIRVRWVYLILPLSVFVGACLVLVFTIVETNHRRLQPWKSDVLATFTHSVDAEIQKQLRLAEMDGQAKYAAQSTIVSLVDTGDFLELKVKKD